MSKTSKEVLESLRAFVEGQEGLPRVEQELRGASPDAVREAYERVRDELAEEDPAREALLESLVAQDDLEDQDLSPDPSPPPGPDPDL